MVGKDNPTPEGKKNKEPVVKFSHYYDKFVGFGLPEKVQLIQVLKSNREELSEWFVEYDTHYTDDWGVSKNYPLPNGELIILIMKSRVGILTTIRRYTPRKWGYYKSIEGRLVEIVKTK